MQLIPVATKIAILQPNIGVGQGLIPSSDATSHSTNECRIFRQHIQRAIRQGRLKFDTPRKMKVDDNPFLGDQNMVGVGLFKEKTKVLTSTKSREAGTVDSKMQISADEYREIRKRRDQQRSRYEPGETSKDGATKPRVTSRILLNKWQRQKEKDYQRWLEDQEYQHQLEEERYERKQVESY